MRDLPGWDIKQAGLSPRALEAVPFRSGPEEIFWHEDGWRSRQIDAAPHEYARGALGCPSLCQAQASWDSWGLRIAFSSVAPSTRLPLIPGPMNMMEPMDQWSLPFPLL